MSGSGFVFSDESGSWHSGPVYVRSWVKMSNDVYEQVKREVVYKKHLADVKELKYDKFQCNQGNFNSIFSFDFTVFVTISIPEHFEKRKYTILQTLQGIDISKSTGGEQITESIKTKVINSAKNILYFVYFENHHIKNSQKALIDDLDYDDYEYQIDIPQCQPKEWKVLASENGIKNIKVIRRSEECPGVELADVVAGCIYNKIMGDGTASQIYNDYVKSKMADMASRTYPNPNMIFFQDFTDDQKKLCSGFR